MQRGHVFKQGNGWGVRWRQLDPATGKRKLMQQGGFRTRALANHWLRDKLDELQMAGTSYRPEMTVSELIEQYRLQRPRKSQAREQSIKSHIKKIGAQFGGVRLNALDVGAIGAWRNTLPVGSAWDVITTFRMLLNFAHRAGYLTRDIAKLIDNPPPPRQVRAKRAAFDSIEEIEAIADELPVDYRGAVLFLHATGMRPGEMIPLERRDVDFASGWIMLVRAQGLREETKGKKGAIPRRVPLWPDARRAIELAPQRLDSPYLFPAPDGQKIRLKTLEATWRRAVFAAGIEPFRELYDLRHTHISWAIRAGVPISDVAKWCGTSIQQIDKTYRHLVPGAEEAAFRLWQELVTELSQRAQDEDLDGLGS